MALRVDHCRSRFIILAFQEHPREGSWIRNNISLNQLPCSSAEYLRTGYIARTSRPVGDRRSIQASWRVECQPWSPDSNYVKWYRNTSLTAGRGFLFKRVIAIYVTYAGLCGSECKMEFWHGSIRKQHLQKCNMTFRDNCNLTALIIWNLTLCRTAIKHIP